jgi:hypothetical protein
VAPGRTFSVRNRPYPSHVPRPLDDQPDAAIARRAQALRGHVEETYRSRPSRSEFDEFPSEADIERFGGVTMSCAGCGSVLHDDVAVCWNCGRAVGQGGEEVGAGRSWWPMILIALLVVALVIAIIT